MKKICVLTNENNIVVSWGECLSEEHIPLENGTIIEVDLDLEIISLVGNYKLLSGELIKLTEEEKSIVEPQPTEIEILRDYILELDYKLITMELGI